VVSARAAGTSRGAAHAVPCRRGGGARGGYEEVDDDVGACRRAAGRPSLSVGRVGSQRRRVRVRRMSLWLAQAGRTRDTRPAPCPATRRPSPLPLARPYCSLIRTYAICLYSTLLDSTTAALFPSLYLIVSFTHSPPHQILLTPYA
jgi:hypothetical protein